MVGLIEIFHTAHHSIEVGLAIFILYVTFFAIKKFKLAIWKKGWHVIGLGAFLFALVETQELLEVYHLIAESTTLTVFMHSLHIIAFACIAIGIFLLASSAGKIWGK